MRPPDPKRSGGRGAPYIAPKEDAIRVFDASTAQYRRANRHERLDDSVDKYLADAFGGIYVYRCNKGHDLAEHEFMHSANFDLYSTGEDEVDQTRLGDAGDDIGSW